MSDRDFEIGTRKFKLNKIDAFKQFHVVRRLGPILGDIIPVAQKLKGLNSENQSQDEMFDAIAKISQPILIGLSKLSDADSNMVLISLCSAVEMQQSMGNWARVATDAGLMFQDLDLPTLLQIAGRAFIYNLSGFFAAAPQVSHGGK
jgi:hypothetical protein